MANWTEQDLRDREARMNAPMPTPTPKRGDSSEDRGQRMNKTETRFSQYLNLQMKAGEIRRWWFEAIKIRIGASCFWCPDFLVENNDGSLVLYDTKGAKRNRDGSTSAFAKDDAIVKARAVAANFPIPVYFTWPERDGSWNRKRM